MGHCKTMAPARQLGISYARLMGAIRTDKMKAPAKDSSGDYIWTADDLENARRALSIDLRRKVKKPEPETA